MKHKKTHLGLGLKVISILSCVALLAVGFANWWIIQKPDAAVSEGNFDVYAVSNKYINITATNTTTKDSTTVDNWLSNDSIVFGKSTVIKNGTNAGTTVAPSWLMATNVGNAVLDTTLSFTLTLSDNASSATATSESNVYLDDMISTVTITLTPAAASTGQINLASAVTKGYLATPSVSAKYGAAANAVNSSLTNTATAYNQTTGVITMTFAVPADVKQIYVDVTFSFDWGSKFGGENPFVYYNQLTYSDSNASTAFTDLGELAKLTETKYDINISTALISN